jgi:hypothetical protein
MTMTDLPTKERKRKVVFTKEEDQMILNFVETFGATRWERIENLIKTRTSRQCRERYKNFLSPAIIKKDWTSEEDSLLTELVSQNGKKWSKFAQYFPGRTDILIKNRFSLLMRHEKTGKRIHNHISLEPVIFSNDIDNNFNSSTVGFPEEFNDTILNESVEFTERCDEFCYEKDDLLSLDFFF